MTGEGVGSDFGVDIERVGIVGVCAGVEAVDGKYPFPRGSNFPRSSNKLMPVKYLSDGR